MRKDIYDNIPSSTPMNYFTGIEDHPGEGLPPREPMFPIHCPLVPLFLAKGSTKKQYLTAAEKYLQHDVNSFDPISEYYNEYTMLSNILAYNGNVHATIRVKPDDAPPPANFTLYVDILETTIPLYNRNSDGSYALDGLGDPTASGTTPGCRLKYFVKHHTTGIKRGEQTILPGTLTDGSNTSNMYPIMDVPAAEFGKWYSNLGMKIAPTTGERLQPKFAQVAKALPYEISIYTRPNEKTTGSVFKSLSGGSYTQVCFKKNTIHPYTEAQLDVDLLFPHNWYNEDPSGSRIRPYDIDNIHFYYDNLEAVLNKIIPNEVNHLSNTPATWTDNVDSATLDWFDFTNATDISDEAHLVNWITLKSSNRKINYFTAIKDDTTVVAPADMEEITVGDDSIIYLRGGGDGTISMATMQDFIANRIMPDYLDGDSEVMSLVMNKESSFYDVGVDLPTKKAIANFIAIRPDTVVHWCTHIIKENNEIADSLDDEYAVAQAIMARAEIFPESEIFATTVCRATITLGSMRDIDSKSKYRYTQNYEVANILAAYLGALNGKMKPLKCLDAGRSNTVLTLGRDYQPEFIPDSFKETIWTTGVMYSEPYKINQKAFLAMKTIHNNEQSVLTSPIVIYTNGILCRVMDDAHKEFSGNEKDSRDVFANNIIAFCNKKMRGVIDNDRYRIEFEVIWTDGDDVRKYSYHLVARLYANVMKTAQVTTVATYAN